MTVVTTFGKWAQLMVLLWLFTVLWTAIWEKWDTWQESRIERALLFCSLALATATVLAISVFVAVK